MSTTEGKYDMILIYQCEHEIINATIVSLFTHHNSEKQNTADVFQQSSVMQAVRSLQGDAGHRDEK